MSFMDSMCRSSESRKTRCPALTTPAGFRRRSPGHNLLAQYGQVTTMPSYKDQLDEDGINQLIAYIKSLGTGGTGLTTASANPQKVPASHSGAPLGSNTTARKQP